jgi:hypothetical protein
MDITLITREYNSWKYSDDKDNIINLPAFHVYFGAGYIKTFYPQDNYVEIIDACVKKYEASQSDMKRLVNMWNTIWPRWAKKQVRRSTQVAEWGVSSSR